MAFLCLHADTERKSFLTVWNVMRNMVLYTTVKVSTEDYDNFTDAEELVSFILNGRK